MNTHFVILKTMFMIIFIIALVLCYCNHAETLFLHYFRSLPPTLFPLCLPPPPPTYLFLGLYQIIVCVYGIYVGVL